MYMGHGSGKLPDDLETPIWRYMDFTKFVYMLDKKSLFFCRPDCLDDRFEGTWGRASLESIERDLKDRLAAGTIIDLPVKQQMDGIKLNAEALRKETAVNCWHLSAHESEAMWRLYIQAGQGIAICSTTYALIKSFPDDRQLLIHIGCVNYIDYDTESIPFDNYLNPFLYKRRSFEHERELRAVAIKGQVEITEDRYSESVSGEEFARPGESVSVDLAVLIQSVHLAPGSPKWMSDLAESVVKQYGLAVPVKRSRLDDEPN